MITTLKDIRKDNHFQSFFDNKKAANSTKEIGQPDLPRKRKQQNYSILQYVTNYEGSAANAYHLETTKEYLQTDVF